MKKTNNNDDPQPTHRLIGTLHFRYLKALVMFLKYFNKCLIVSAWNENNNNNNNDRREQLFWFRIFESEKVQCCENKSAKFQFWCKENEKYKSIEILSVNINKTNENKIHRSILFLITIMLLSEIAIVSLELMDGFEIWA